MAENVGLNYFHDNDTIEAMGIDPRNIHPDILEDSILLTVSN